VPGATPREAVDSFLRSLRRVVSCITRDILDVRVGYYPSEKPHSVIIGDGLSVPLAGRDQLKLRLGLNYRIIEVAEQLGTWNVSIAAYYRLRGGALNGRTGCGPLPNRKDLGPGISAIHHHRFPY
jgi:hypothetical protein